MVSAFKYIQRHIGLEGAAPPEDYQGVEARLIYSQEGRKGLNVPVVLSQWILKFELLLAYNLSPLFILCAAEYPTFVVLRFDNEYAKFRNDDMVKLCCPVSSLNRNVPNLLIRIWVEVQTIGYDSSNFAGKPLEARFPRHNGSRLAGDRDTQFH